MDEQQKTLPDEDRRDDDEQDRFGRALTQRELVRASLLRCPPPQTAEPPRP